MLVYIIIYSYVVKRKKTIANTLFIDERIKVQVPIVGLAPLFITSHFYTVVLFIYVLFPATKFASFATAAVACTTTATTTTAMLPAFAAEMITRRSNECYHNAGNEYITYDVHA